MKHISKYIFISCTSFFLLLSHNSNAQYEKIIAQFKYLAPVDRARFFLGSMEDEKFKFTKTTIRDYVHTVERYAKTNNDKVLLREINFLYNVWQSSKHSPSIEEEIVIFASLIKEYEKRGKALEIGYIHHFLAQIHFKEKAYELSFENYFKAMDAFKDVGYENVPTLSKLLHDFALSHYHFKEYREVIELMKIALKYPPFNKSHDIQRYNNLGMAYLKMDITDSAKYFFNETYHVAEKYKSEIWKTLATNNLGDLHFRLGKYTDALKYYKKVLEYKGDDFYYPLNFNLYVSLAKTYLKLDENKKAKAFIDKVENTLHKFQPTYYGDEQQLEKAKGHYYEVKLDYFTNIGDFKNALSYKDSLLMTQKVVGEKYNPTTAKIAANKLLIHKKELKIAQREQEKSELRAFYIALVSCILFLGGASYGYIFISRQKKLRLNEQLVAQNKIEMLEKQKLKIELQTSKKEISNFITKINEHSNLVSKLELELGKLKVLEADERKHVIETVKQLKSARILTDDDWIAFLQNFEKVFPELTMTLKTHQPTLSISEMRYLMLTQLDFSNKEMARAIGVSESGIRLTLSRVRKKLNGSADDTPKTLLQYIQKKTTTYKTEIT